MLAIHDVHVRYPGASVEAVRGVSLRLTEQGFAGLVGESGSGKTTLVMAILGLLPTGSEVLGQICFDGVDVLSFGSDTLLGGPATKKWSALRARRIALVPQGAQNSFTPVVSIGAQIEEVLRAHLNLRGEAAHQKVASLLTDVELDPATAKRFPHELSGGQKQRAAIALALACGPQLLLADEPTTALDVITQAEILKLLGRLRVEKGLAVLLVTHDLPLAASVCSELFVMKDGLIVENGTPRELLNAPNHPYTRRLVEALL